MGERIPVIHIISDSVGETGRAVAQAAAAQFGITNPRIEVIGKVKSFDQVRSYLEEHVQYHQDLGDDMMVVFYTLVHSPLRDAVSAYIDEHPNIYGVDLLTSAINAISETSGRRPNDDPGALRVADINYFHRVEALEFTIEHDDGRNPQDLPKADIVIIGVSRTSKTPLCIYLAEKGFHVANIPLDPHTQPPKELFEIDRTRIFGLMSSPDVLTGIRKRRISFAKKVALSYADIDYIYDDLEKARALMRKLGCYIIRTDNRAVEETAQEIIDLYSKTHTLPEDEYI